MAQRSAALYAALDKVLTADGWIKGPREIYIYPSGSRQFGWFATANDHLPIYPKVGIFNRDIQDIVTKVGKKIYEPQFGKIKKSKWGPANFMTGLDALIGNDASFSDRQNWDGTCGNFDLVAENILFCLRHKAYQYFSDNLDMNNLLDTALHKSLFSQSLQYSAPVLIILLKRDDLLNDFVQYSLKQYPSPDHELAQLYLKYVAMLPETIEDSPLRDGIYRRVS